METIPWFEYDDEDDLGTAQREFADVLADRARSWPVDPLSTVLLPLPHTPYRQLLTYLDIDDPERNQVVLTIGAHFDGTVVHADKLHNQNFTLPETGTETEFAFSATGSPTDLARRTADWFEAILDRPLVRCEWLYAGKRYAVRYEYANTGRGLCEGFEDTLAPSELRKRLTAEGVVRGRGRINRAGLGEPHRIVRVRGNRTAL
ncbi:hypothetical protein ACFS5L_44420 [Streptomyces phyllanthi]|uniref:Uncharacterized protein n=1 Tax=Streptomyces phyllanthi TaxID=1803180 RepID=A0A5N8WE05_9ACTN|nr:hypothetical protein [Streptomyces phyllanthi]MPY45683.1 hypothetical protein [Streptomyces phyllanthi]